MKKLVFSFLLFLMVAASVEITARVFSRLVEKEPAVPRHLKVFDERYGWSLMPNEVATSWRTGEPVEYRINSIGARDDETPYDKPEGTFRIVLLGDSRSFGNGVPIEKHFSSLLEGYFEDVEVINLGVGGFGVDQELLRLRLEGLRYQPDLVLAYVAHYSDHRHMHTERWGRQKPRFVMDESGDLVLINSPVPSPFEGGNRLHEWLDDHVATYSFVSRWVVLARKGLGFETGEIETQRDQRAQDSRNLKDRAYRRELQNLGARIVQEMDATARAHGAEFVLVTGVGKLHRRMLKRGIHSLDVREALDNPGFPLPDGLAHLNRAGNGALTWEIARFLKQNRLVPERHWRGERAAAEIDAQP